MKNPLTPKQTQRAMNALYGNSTEPIRKARKKPVQRESKLQRACVKFFNIQYPHLYYSLFAVPNGGSRNAIEASRMKLEGVTSGVSDLVFAYNETVSFIELKAKGGRQTETQKEFQSHITQQGFEYYIVDSFEDFQSLIRDLTDQKPYNGKAKTEIGA